MLNISLKPVLSGRIVDDTNNDTKTFLRMEFNKGSCKEKLISIKEEAGESIITVTENTLIDPNTKKLGSKELFVNLERDDLEKLKQGFFSENQREIKKEGKSKWRRHNNANEAKVHGCRSCKFISDSKYLLLVHILENHEDVAKQKNIPRIDQLIPGTDPGDIWYKCTDCSYVTFVKHCFQNHLKTHVVDDGTIETYRCADCSFNTKYKECIRKHVKTHIDAFYTCPHCTFQTRQQSYLNTHVSMIHKTEEIQLLKCNICGFETKYHCSLKRHLLIHTNGRKMYKCDKCPFETPYLAVLKKSHSLKHTSDEAKIYECAHCPYKAKIKQYLIQHLITHRKEEYFKRFKCEICSFSTKNMVCLKLHRETHVKVKEEDLIPCERCPYKAKSKQLMKMHSRLHLDPSEGVMYKCKECTYQSRRGANVKRHSITHKNKEDLPSFKCEDCEYRSVDKHRLRTHRRVMHTDPENIDWKTCLQCGFKTKHIGNLKRHMLNHKDPNEVNIFKCNECSFTAKSKGEIGKHFTKHTDMYLTCNECGNYKVKCRDTLQRHLVRRHGYKMSELREIKLVYSM